MKKKFALASLLLASALTAPQAHAETAATKPGAGSPPALKINGNSTVTIFASSQSNAVNGKNANPYFYNESYLYFTVLGQASNGIEYMYKITMRAHVTSDPTIRQNYVQFNGKFGTIQMGNVPGPENGMIQDGSTIIGGTGGFAGDYHASFNLAAFTLRGNDLIGDSGDATKVAYYTPDMYGFRFGIAYTPNTNQRGDDALDNRTSHGNEALPGNRTLWPIKKPLTPIGVNNFAYAVNFTKELGKWGITLSGSYVHDQAYIPGDKHAGTSRLRLTNTSAYQLGGILGYKFDSNNLLQVAGGYFNNKHSRLPTSSFNLTTLLNNFRWDANPSAANTGNLNLGNAGHGWNVASAYTTGAYKYAVSYQGTARRTDSVSWARNHVYSGTIDVSPLKGINFFGEVNYAHSKSNAAATSLANAIIRASGNQLDSAVQGNHGFVAAVGTKISF